MKVCICFFGLTRSLKYTIDSIKLNLFNVLESNNIEFDVFLHTYNLEYITNKRSDEFNEKLDYEEYKLLEPKEFIIENQDDFDNSFDYDIFSKIRDYYNDKKNSYYNVIRQLNSLKKVTSLIKDKEKYDDYIYIRPDLKIVNELDVNFLLEKYDNNYFITPNFGKWRGLNDRFVIANYDSIIKYGERIDDIIEFISKKNYLHSEQFLNYVTKKYDIKNYDINIILLRVRANGKIPDNDLMLIKN